jgi:hypothetical protein
MGYTDKIREFIRKVRNLFVRKSKELQPRDILSKLISELEKKKKLGIEENAFVPNVYAIYLSPIDHDEISPLLSGIRDQLKNKLLEKVKKNGYKLLSTTINIDIREDSALQRNQIVVESSFLKEKTPSAPVSECKVVPFVNDKKEEVKENAPEPVQKSALTRIIEDKKTKIIDNTKAKIEILEGESKGEIIALKEGEYTFGRGKEAVILIRDTEDTVSRVHFKVTVRDGRVSIRDLNSANGTKVNDIDIEEAELKKGDTITAGKVLLRVA